MTCRAGTAKIYKYKESMQAKTVGENFFAKICVRKLRKFALSENFRANKLKSTCVKFLRKKTKLVSKAFSFQPCL